MATTRRHIGRPGKRITFLLWATVIIFSTGLPLSAQQAKNPRREGADPEPKRMNHPQAVEQEHRRIEEQDRARERAAREAEIRSRATKNARPEDEYQEGQKPRKGLPIIEGTDRERMGRRKPEEPSPKRQINEPAPRPILRDDANQRIKGTLDRFGNDWVRGDSRALTELLSSESRVKITIESKGINDSFGSGQAQYVLREYINSADVRDLNFSRFRISPTDDSAAYGVGKMRMRDRKTGKISNHTVYISMAREGERWAVREIRVAD